MPVSAEGRVEHQKLNQIGWVFGVQLDSLEKSVSANAEKRLDFTPKILATVRATTIRRHSGADPAFRLDNLVIDTGHFVVDQRFSDDIIIPVFLLNFEFF